MVLYVDSIMAIPVWGIVYYVRWDGCYRVYVCLFGEWELLWCSIFVVDYKDGYCVCLFFGYHSSLVKGF